MSEINYETLARQLLGNLGVTYKNVPSGTPSATMGHGPGGLFSSAGLSRPVFSAMILPKLGMQSLLPIRPANDFNPLHGIMTGVTASSGSEAEGVCDDPPTSGLMKLCTHSFVFGRLSRMTKVFDLDTFGRITNRGEFTDLQLFGNPFAEANPAVPTMPAQNSAANALNNEIAKALFELGVAWSRDFGRLLYTGSPANNTAGGGYKEFWGFQTLVNTGYQDAETQQLCPAADSLVMSFGNNNVTGNEGSLIRTVTYMFRNLNYLAARASLTPVSWVMTMPFSLFYELTDMWPCQYLSYRCTTTGTASTQFIDAVQANQMRDAMRGDLYNRVGQYLLIDGQRVPVVLDDAVPETNIGGGTFASELYFIPMTVLGQIPVTYLEYFNYDAPSGALEAAQILSPTGSFYTSDNGRFLWHRKPPNNFCVQMLAKSEPRLIVETPYLAGRLTNIRYSPLDHERWPFPDAAGMGPSYYKDGGKTHNPSGSPSFFDPIRSARGQ